MVARDFATKYEASVFAVYERMLEAMLGKHPATEGGTWAIMITAAATLTLAAVVREIDQDLVDLSANWGRGA